MASIVVLACCLAVLAMLVMTALRQPHQLLRPSALVLLFMHARIQWPTIFMGAEIQASIESEFVFHLLVNLFMVAATLILILTGRGRIGAHARTLLTSLQRPAELQASDLADVGRIIVLITALIASVYLVSVPFSQTGLYVLFSDPTGLSAARESSLKLLDSGLLQYMFSWQINTFAPFLLVVGCVRYRGADSTHGKWMAIGLMAWGAFNMTLIGSRAGFAFVILVLLCTHLILRRGRVNWVLYLLGGIAILMVPTVISMAREGQEFTGYNFWAYMRMIGVGRIFEVPVRTGIYYFQYVELVGHVGVSSVRPLAILFDMEFVNLPRSVGSLYVTGASESVVTNTNFLFYYYAAFGIFSLPISLFGLFVLDAFLLFVKSKHKIILPVVVLFFLKAGSMSEGVFTTSIVTGGFILIPFLILIATVSRLGGISKRRGVDS